MDHDGAPEHEAAGDAAPLTPGELLENIRRHFEADGQTPQDYWLVRVDRGYLGRNRRVESTLDPACWDLALVVRSVRESPGVSGHCMTGPAFEALALGPVLDFLRGLVVRAGGGTAGLRHLHRIVGELAPPTCDQASHGHANVGLLVDAYYLRWRDVLLEVLEWIRTGQASPGLWALLTSFVTEVLAAVSRVAGPDLDLPAPVPRAGTNREGIGPIQRRGPPARTWASPSPVLPVLAA